MNLGLVLDHLKAAAIAAGVPERNVSADARKLNDTDRPTPLAVILPVDGELEPLKGAKVARVPTTTPTPAAPKLYGVRRQLWGGSLTYQVAFVTKSRQNLESVASAFLLYLAKHPLADAGGNDVPCPSGRVAVDWDDYGLDGFQVVTFRFRAGADVFEDSQRVPLDVELEFEIVGGNPDE